MEVSFAKRYVNVCNVFMRVAKTVFTSVIVLVSPIMIILSFTLDADEKLRKTFLLLGLLIGVSLILAYCLAYAANKYNTAVETIKKAEEQAV